MKKQAIYPGTFDPITNGHLDIIKRASKIFDFFIVAIAENPGKKTLFTLSERLKLVKGAVRSLNCENIEVVEFYNLVTKFACHKNTNILVRSIRSVTDFEYEMQMKHMNCHLAPELESIFFMPSKEWSFISSSIVKEIASYQGDVSSFLPEHVDEALIKKLG